VADWEELPEWQRATDIEIFEAISQTRGWLPGRGRALSRDQLVRALGDRRAQVDSGARRPSQAPEVTFLNRLSGQLNWKSAVWVVPSFSFRVNRWQVPV
jgi:hypothetical protein